MPKGKLVVSGKFEWWSEKDEANILKHKDANNNGISFNDILSVFDDPYFCIHGAGAHAYHFCTSCNIAGKENVL